jgi:hypothetical protein
MKETEKHLEMRLQTVSRETVDKCRSALGYLSDRTDRIYASVKKIARLYDAQHPAGIDGHPPPPGSDGPGDK